MPSQPDNNFPEGEQRTGLQPFLLPTKAKPTTPPMSRWITFLTKIAISARLLGKELHRERLKWFDLRRADYRLGEKVVTAGIPSEHSEFARQLEQIDQRLACLRQFRHERSDTFGEKVKSWAKGIVRMAQIAAAERRRHRLLKRLAAAVRKNPASDRSIAGELESANLITEKISTVDAAIRDLRGGTYIWARRPLFASLLLMILTIVGLLSFKAATQQRFGSRENSSSSLSEDQFKTLETQTAAFREQLLRQQAELRRQEIESTQQRIAAAERQHKEQRDRERAEVQKRAREQAQKDEEARREQAEREKQQQQLAAAEQARLEREEAQAKKLAREKAEREKAEADRAAGAERARKEEEQRAARLAEQKRQQEEDERAAQKIPASQLIAKSDLEAIMGFALQAPEDREVNDGLAKRSLPGVEESSSCFFASASPPKSKYSFRGVMLTIRYLRDPDSDHAETVVRNIMKADYQSVYDFDEVPNLQYAGFYLNFYASIFVFKATLRGSTLLQVGIEGAPSEESARDDNLWRQHLFDRETKIALKVLGPPRSRVASYQGRHPREREEIQSSYLPDIPGVDPKVMRFFDGFYKRAAAADASRISNSKSVVAASGGTKMLCPKCHGSQLMVTHAHDYSVNPHDWGTLEHGLFENAREKTNFVSCDQCGGTGVVDAR
jgi:hypothetical protein